MRRGSCFVVCDGRLIGTAVGPQQLKAVAEDVQTVEIDIQAVQLGQKLQDRTAGNALGIRGGGMEAAFQIGDIVQGGPPPFCGCPSLTDQTKAA